MYDWWLEEQSFAGQEHLDADYVAGYDAKAQFDPTEDIELLKAHGLGPGSSILDLGAGTGTFAMAAAACGATVTAVDVSTPMVAHMSGRFEAAGLAAATAVQGGFLSYRRVGAPVDFVYSRNALHQLPDFWKVIALRRAREWLKPGGILRLRDLVFDLEPTAVEAGIELWKSFAVDDAARGYTAAEFSDHVRSEFSTFAWLLEPMLERCGFEILDRELRLAYGAYSCRAR